MNISLIAESSALGAALLAPNQATELVQRGHIELFTTTAHQAIFEALCRLNPQTIDYAIVADELHRRDQLDEVGWDVLLHLDDGVVTNIPMAARLDRLWELWRLRQLALLGERLSTQCDAPGICSVEIIAATTQRIEEIAAR